jgi:hypothetical protein
LTHLFPHIRTNKTTSRIFLSYSFNIPKPVWAVGFALEQTLRDATLAVFSFLILKRLQHIIWFTLIHRRIYRQRNSLKFMFARDKIFCQPVKNATSSYTEAGMGGRLRP